MNILVVDIGGTNVKIWRSETAEKTKIPSGKELTPAKLFEDLQEILRDWEYERVSIGYPGEVLHNQPKTDAYNLGEGWVGVDFGKIFGKPVRVMNDACMQALGSYEGGKMLYIGLGTGMGTTFINEKQIVPLALGHLKFCRGEDFNHYLSRKGLELHGAKRWNRAVYEAAATLKQAFMADYVVLGGGNAKKLKDLPEGCRLGSNFNAYLGGVRMWDDADVKAHPQLAVFDEPPPPRTAVEA